MIELNELESLIEQSKNIKIKLNEEYFDKDLHEIELHLKLKSDEEKLAKQMSGMAIVYNKDENELNSKIFEDNLKIVLSQITNWSNVKYKHILNENLKNTLISSGKFNEEDLEKDVKFSNKLLSELLSNYNIIMLVFNLINTKTQKKRI